MQEPENDVAALLGRCFQTNALLINNSIVWYLQLENNSNIKMDYMVFILLHSFIWLFIAHLLGDNLFFRHLRLNVDLKKKRYCLCPQGGCNSIKYEDTMVKELVFQTALVASSLRYWELYSVCQSLVWMSSLKEE